MLLWGHAPSLGGTRPPRRLMSGWLLSPPALKKLGDAPAVRVPGYLGPFVNLSRGLLCWCSRTRVTPSGSTASPLVCSSRARSPASSSERLRPLALVHLHLGWCGWWDSQGLTTRGANLRRNLRQGHDSLWASRRVPLPRSSLISVIFPMSTEPALNAKGSRLLHSSACLSSSRSCDSLTTSPRELRSPTSCLLLVQCFPFLGYLE